MRNVLKIDNKQIPYKIIKSNRRKSSTIIVDESGITVRVPNSKTLAETHKMLEKKRHWISYKRWQFMRKQRAADNPTLLYMGKKYPIKILTRQKMYSISLYKNRIIIRLEGDYSSIFVEKIYDLWILQMAEKYLPTRTKYLSKHMKIIPPKIAIKKFKSRWGSANKKGDVRFNSDLIKMPKKIIDYIIVHELCHLKIQNHSPRFWELLRFNMPNYKRQKEWIDAYGASLIRDMRV